MKLFKRMLSLFTVLMIISSVIPRSALAAGGGEGRTGGSPAGFAAASAPGSSASYTNMQYEQISLPFAEGSSIGLPDDGTEVVSAPDGVATFMRGYKIELTAGQEVAIDIRAEFNTYNFLLKSVTGDINLTDVIDKGLDSFSADEPGTYYILVVGSGEDDLGNYIISAYDPGDVRKEPLDFTADPGPGSSGEGWTWDENTQTLTLNGLYLDLSDSDVDFAVSLPENSKIVLNGISMIKYGSWAGIKCRGDLQILGDGSLFIYYGGDTEVPGAGIVTDGGLTVSGCGTIYAEGYMGMCAVNPYIEDNSQNIGPNLMNADMTQPSAGIMDFVGDEMMPDLVIENCGSVIIDSMFAGVMFNNVSILNCGRVIINSWQADSEEPETLFGITADGNVLISDCDFCSALGGFAGISSRFGITIRNSEVEAFGYLSGIATGMIFFSVPGSGGDIVIDNSTVRTSCGGGEESFGAALFAGDDVGTGEEGRHSRIVLYGCVIKEPEGGRILDVNIDNERCQSVTDVPNIPTITGFEQCANSVLIVPVKAESDTRFTVSYHPNGGMGSVPMDMNLYYAGDNVTLMPGTGISRPGYAFMGWSLTDSAAPINELTMGNHDVTLFAVWGEGGLPEVPKTGDDASAFGWLMLAAGLAAAAVLFVVRRRRARA